jgi:predicted nucleic acid-binding protein
VVLLGAPGAGRGLAGAAPIAGVRNMKVTLDTNVLWDYVENRDPERHESASAILEAHRVGRCNVAVTSRVLGDTRNKRGALSGIQEKLKALLDEYQISEIGTNFRLDVSCFMIDTLADESVKGDEQRLLTHIWPRAHARGEKHSRRLRDIDHLLGHRRHGRDVFVTSEKAILENRGVLQREFGIDVASPAELVERLRSVPTPYL